MAAYQIYPMEHFLKMRAYRNPCLSCFFSLFPLLLSIMDFQTDTTQRQPLLSQSDEEIEYQKDDGEEVLEKPVGKYTVLEKLLAFACGWLLLAMCIFAYLYQNQGGGHNHGGAMDMSQFEQVNTTSSP